MQLSSSDLKMKCFRETRELSHSFLRPHLQREAIEDSPTNPKDSPNESERLSELIRTHLQRVAIEDSPNDSGKHDLRRLPLPGLIWNKSLGT